MERGSFNGWVALLVVSPSLTGLMAVLDPDLVVGVDGAGARAGAQQEVRGAQNWAKGAVAFARFIQPATVCLVDGAVGAVWSQAAGWPESFALR
jgi:hypothetical protein